MPCNLAVTIAKAAVTDEQLLALLTPQMVADTIKAAMDVLGVRITPRISGKDVYAYAETSYRDQISIGVSKGKVTVRASTDARGEEIATALSGAIGKVADALFANAVGEALRQLTGKRAVVKNATVTDDGATLPAYILSVKL